MASANRHGCIEPDILYHHADAAARLGKSAKAFKDQLIRTGDILFCPVGSDYWILGSDLIQYAKERRIRWSDAENPRSRKSTSE